MLTTRQRLQLLRPFRNSHRQRDVALHHRHVPHALHLDCLAGSPLETFKWLQVVGFALLVYFTFLFNGVVNPPFKWLQTEEEPEELLPEEPIEHH